MVTDTDTGIITATAITLITATAIITGPRITPGTDLP